MADREGDELLTQARAKLSYKGWFGGNKLDEAAELFVKAANRFQMAKKWKEAGDAFSQAADCQIRMDERDEAASTLVNASKAYKKVSPTGESLRDAAPTCQSKPNELTH